MIQKEYPRIKLADNILPMTSEIDEDKLIGITDLAKGIVEETNRRIDVNLQVMLDMEGIDTESDPDELKKQLRTAGIECVVKQVYYPTDSPLTATLVYELRKNGNIRSYFMYKLLPVGGNSLHISFGEIIKVK